MLYGTNGVRERVPGKGYVRQMVRNPPWKHCGFSVSTARGFLIE